MYTNIGKLLTARISHADLYNFAVRSSAMIQSALPENSTIQPYVEAVSLTTDAMEAVFSRSLKHPLTIEINVKHSQRSDLLVALKRSIGSSEKISSNQTVSDAAKAIKQELINRDLWQHHYLSYGLATATIRSILEMLNREPFSQWVSILGLQTIIDQLQQTQTTFEVLVNERIEDKSKDTVMVMVAAKQKLLDALLPMLVVIDFGVTNDPTTYQEIGGYLEELIQEINAKTRASATRDQNSDDEVVDEDDSLEPEETPVYE